MSNGRYEFSLTGEMPLLMHADDVLKAGELNEWRKAPENKNLSVAGDDRSPAWTWQTYCYTDGENLAMPQENIMVCLRQAGSQMILKKQKTFKEITQSGLVMDGEFCQLLVGGQVIPFAEIEKLRNRSFNEQFEAVQKLGFRLFVKRARVGTAKHVRVRARFDDWQIRGHLTVTASEISGESLATLFELAGRVGLGDWRPGCKTPGPYGMFRSEVKRVK